ncbi:MAG TPA: hypothetical protein VH413_06390 [Verrucomicrobiae bacterium]|jgi:hypothetical protein|nr:hypothetical protein [Verrucomicrobiae bacterium]
MAFASLRLGGDSRLILPSRNFSIGLALALMLMVMGVYFPAARFGFINFDDDLYVTANPQVQAGISVRNIEWAFTHAVASNWQPVTVLSHALDCQLFGANAGMAHAENVFIHALNAALVFVLFLELTGAAWPSWFIALLFAIHPLRIESVAWISERKDVLSGFWGLVR